MTQPFDDPDFPIRSSASFIASFTMQGIGLILITEGRENDSFVYSQLLPQALSSLDVKYAVEKVQMIDQTSSGIARGSSGKNPVLSLYSSLESSNELNGYIAEDKYYCIFALDKDLDDYNGSMKVSPHIVYTPHYDIEGVLFSRIDILNAIAACASDDHRSVVAKIQTPNIKDIANLWKEWAALCYANETLSLGCFIGYKVSIINSPYHAITDSDLYRIHKDTLISRGISNGLSGHEVESKIEEGISIMEGDEYYKIFKGKWYIKITASILKGHYRVNNPDGLVATHIRSVQDYRSLIWQEFKQAVETAETFLIT